MAGVRSPNYPILSLADAVARVQTLYDREGTHAADREVVARALGFGSLNGASRGVLSALQKYGLLVEEGEQLRVSAEALDVLLHSSGRPERVGALQRALLLPPLFSDLLAQFGRSLPSDENLRAYLIKRGFNPHTVTQVIRSYRDSVAFVDQEERGLEACAAGPGAEAAPTAPAPGAVTWLPGGAARERTELAFQLSEGCHARVLFEGGASRADLLKLMAFLDLSMDAFPAAAETTEA